MSNNTSFSCSESIKHVNMITVEYDTGMIHCVNTYIINYSLTVLPIHSQYE